MATSIKQSLIDLVWIPVAFTATIIICRYVFFWDAKHNSLDIHLHDTYFVFDFAEIIIPLFLLLTFLFYFIKTLRSPGGSNLSKIILLVSGMLLVVSFMLVNRSIMKFTLLSGSNYTLYPPLSRLGADREQEDPLFVAVSNALIIGQVGVTLALLYSTFLWGRHAKYRQVN